MFIAINGQLGSGKSELCKRLEEEYGFDVFHTGKIQREYAAELGISTLELNRLCKTDKRFDKIIDSKLVEYAERVRGKDVVFDSRMAWHFVPGVFKVHLLVSPDIAADRVYGKRESVEETYSSREEAMANLVERSMLENERYLNVYGVTMNDYRNYDLILDTSLLTVKEELDIILDAAKQQEESGEFKGIFVSPVSLYPTETYDMSDNEVRVVKRGESLYIVSGHRKVREAVLRGERLIEIALAAEDGDEGAEKFVPNTDRETLKDWEEMCGFRYGYVPLEVRAAGMKD